jgi:3-oxoadipate enol-lactonase
MAARPDSTSLLAGISLPALAIAGAEDAVISVEQTRVLADAIPGARFESFEQCGHLPNLEDAPRFSDIAGRFLRAALSE